MPVNAAVTVGAVNAFSNLSSFKPEVLNAALPNENEPEGVAPLITTLSNSEQPANAEGLIIKSVVKAAENSISLISEIFSKALAGTIIVPVPESSSKMIFPSHVLPMDV